MMKRLLLLLTVVAPLTVVAVGGTPDLRWTHGGLDANGNPTSVDSYTVYCERPDGTEPVQNTTFNEFMAISEVPLSDGEWSCVVTASNAVGEGLPSNRKTFFVKAGSAVGPAVPAAPSWLPLDGS